MRVALTLMAGPAKVPYCTRTGKLLSYPGYEPEWRDATPFRATLVFVEFERGRSAAHAIFEDNLTKQRYPMFLADLAAAVKHLYLGQLVGEFGYAKRGQNFGVKFIGPVTTKETS